MRADQRFIPSLPTLPPFLLAPTLAASRPPLFPLDRLGSPSAQRWFLARAAVWHATRHFLGGRPGKVLMPAYHHGVEVEAVRAGGGDVVFYRVGADMQVDLDDVRRLLADPQVRLGYLTHFIGFPQPVAGFARLCAEHDVPLIEDCALALLSAAPDGRPLGSTGDASIFCLYKTLPVPHGGLLLSDSVPPPGSLGAPPLLSTLHHVAGLVLADFELRSPGLGRAVRQAARSAARSTVDAVVPTVKTGTMYLSPHELDLGASALVARLLPRFDLRRVVERRRRNFERLAAQLRERVHVYGDPLPPGTCPLFVPVRVREKRALLNALRARGIDAIDFWGIGDPSCPEERFPEVQALRHEVLELPCHQSLDDQAIDFVARTAQELLPASPASIRNPDWRGARAGA